MTKAELHKRCKACSRISVAAIAAATTLLSTGDQELLVLAKSLSDRYSVLVSKPAVALNVL